MGLIHGFLHSSLMIVFLGMFLGLAGSCETHQKPAKPSESNHQHEIDVCLEKASRLLQEKKYHSAILHYKQASELLLLDKKWTEAFWLRCQLVDIADSLKISKTTQDIIREMILHIGQDIYPNFHPKTNKKLAQAYTHLSFKVFDVNFDHLYFVEPEAYTFAHESLSRAYDYYLRQKRPNLDTLRLLSMNMAFASYNKGNMYETIRIGSKALEYIQLSGDTILEESVCNLLGASYGNTESYKKAEQYFAHAVNLLTNTRDANAKKFIGRYNNLAKLNYDINKPDQSLFYLKKAQQIIDSLIRHKKNSRNSLLSQIETVYSHKGWTLLTQYRIAPDKDKSLLSESLAYMDSALHTSLSKHYPVENRAAEVALNYSHLGSVYAEMGAFKPAFSYFKKAIAIESRKKKYSQLNLPMNLFLLGRLYYQFNQPRKALIYLQKSLCNNTLDYKTLNPASNPPAHGRHMNDLYFRLAILYKARAYAGLWQDTKLNYYYSMAIKNYLLFDELLSKDRRNRLYKSDQIELTTQYPEAYQEAIGLCLSRYDYEQAFYFSEQSRATILYQQLNETSARAYADIPQKLLDREQKIKTDMYFYNQEILKLKSYSKRKDLENIIGKYQDSVFRLDDQLSKLILNLEQNYPDYYNLKYNQHKTTISEVQNALLDPQSLVINYLRGGEHTYIMAISRNNYRCVKIDISQKYLERRMNRMLESLTSVSRDFSDPAYELYKLLLKPVEDFLAGKKRILIIPDGYMASIPFEALLSQKPSANMTGNRELAYLIRQFSISYYPSLTLAVNAKKKPGHKNFDHELTAIMPVFDSVKLEPNLKPYKDKFLMDDSLRQLHTSEETLRYLFGLFGKPNVRTFLRKQASEDQIKNERFNSRYLVFYTHSFAKTDPDFSAILLYPTLSDSSREDGTLFLEEIFGLSFQTDLIILNSCESGKGKLIQGEGVYSLGWSFMFCGAPNLMQSLWKINEKSASEFLVLFFKKHLEQPGTSYEEALQATKIEFLKHPIYKHPFHWSALVLMGKQFSPGFTQ